MNPPGGVVRLRLSSTLAVDAGDGARSGRELGSRKARTLLALLAASRGRPVATDRIVAALWPEAPPADPAANVATLVSRVRRTLGAGLVEGRPGAYALGGSWSLDLVEAEQWVAEAAGRLAAGEHALAESAAAAALELLGGETALLDEVDDDWVLQVRRDVDALRRAARHHRVAALLELDPATAVRVATEGTGADPYDERAVRDLMRALAADGRAAAALSAYDGLARTLREDLGTDPDRATSDLHLALLRETPVDGEPRRPAPTARGGAAGAAGGPGGRAGAVPRGVGRRGRHGRGRPGARGRRGRASARPGSSTPWPISARRRGPGPAGQVPPGGALPLPPALRRRAAPGTRRAAARPARGDVRDHEAAWVSLVPDLGRGAPATRRLRRPTATSSAGRRTTPWRRRCAGSRRPARSCSSLDDLQDAGAATRRPARLPRAAAGTSRVLLVGAVRSEDPTVAERLGDRARRVHLGPLGPEAVSRSGGRGRPRAARRPGHGAHRRPHPQRGRVPARARRAATPGVPASLSQGVLARVDRLGAESRSVVEAGAVLRRRLDPRLLAGLAEVSEVARDPPRRGAHPRRALRPQRCGLRVRQRPVPGVRVRRPAGGRGRGLPPAGRRPDQRPARGDGHPRARRRRRRPRCAGWLLAGEEALRRAAVEDARTLVERCLAVPGLAGETRARALLVRGRVHEAGTSWTGCHPGHRRGARAGRAASASGGSSWPPCAPAVATRRSAPSCRPTSCWARSRTAYGSPPSSATAGPRPTSASRLTVLEASRLRLSDASVRARPGRWRGPGRRGSQDGVVLALDGLKTVAWHLGDAPALAAAVQELEPLVRARHDAWLLQWVVFESAFVPAAHDDWDEAAAGAARRARPQPAQRLPGLRRLPPGVRRLVGQARRRPRRRAPPRPPVPSRRPRPSTTRGGTPGRRVCWPRRSSRRARRPRRSRLPAPGWPR